MAQDPKTTIITAYHNLFKKYPPKLQQIWLRKPSLWCKSILQNWSKRQFLCPLINVWPACKTLRQMPNRSKAILSFPTCVLGIWRNSISSSSHLLLLPQYPFPSLATLILFLFLLGSMSVWDTYLRYFYFCLIN